jgi:hypothetical protein
MRTPPIAIAKPAFATLAPTHKCASGVILLRKSVKKKNLDGHKSLEEHCWRDVKAMAEFLHLLPVELTLFFQNQGHNTLATQIACKVFLSKSIGIHQFFQHFDARGLFDDEMLGFIIRDQNDKEFGSFRFFRSSSG